MSFLQAILVSAPRRTGLWAALACAGVLAGCGQKGPLFLPQQGAAGSPPALPAPALPGAPSASPASTTASPAAAPPLQVPQRQP